MSLRSLIGTQEEQHEAVSVSAPIDAALNAIVNERRRRVIDLMYSEGAPLPLGVIAEELAALEVGPNYSSGDRKRVYVGLYQCHCDVLAEVDAIRYDDRTGLIYPGDELDALYELLETVREHFDGVVDSQ